MSLRAPVSLLLALAPAAHAGDETKRLGDHVEARVWSPWPASAQKGWAPIFVELRNDSSRDRTVGIEARCTDPGSRSRVQATVELAPGSSGSAELLVPLGAVYTNQYHVILRCGDDSEYFTEAVGAIAARPDVHQVLLLGEFEPEAGAVERWSAELSTRTLEQRGGRALALPAPPGAGSPPPDDIDVAHSRFDGMPRHHAAYSSLDLVVLDPSCGMPLEGQLAPLVAWVRTGGDLLLIGERARAEALTRPELAAWMEPRFESAIVWPGGSEYRCGLGRLFVGDARGELDDEPYVLWARGIVYANGGLTPERGRWRGDGLRPAIPGLGRLPYRTFAGLLFLFAIVIGPVNFVVVHRRKQPVLLLATIPAIALATTMLLLAYGVFFQGLDVKTASYSIAVLDQRAHRSACVETRQLFAGIAPAAGLALGPGTIVHPSPQGTGRFAPGRGRASLEVELASGALLRGDFLPSRTAVNQVLAVERAERGRLDLHRAGDALRADNNLGALVEELIVHDPEGRFHELGAALAPGASGELRAATDPEATGARIEEMLASSLPPTARSLFSTDALPRGCYLARLAASPFRDDCGIETNEKAGAHVVLGVLPLEPEAWR